MTHNQSKTDIVKLGNVQISRYSSALVKRAVEEITLKSPQLVRSAVLRKKILIIGAEIGECLALTLPSEGFDAKFIESYAEPPSKEIFSELSLGKYDMVIVSYWSSWEVLLEIRQRFPRMRTIFLNSYEYEWDAIAEQRGVDAVIRVPFEYDELLTRIRMLLLA